MNDPELEHLLRRYRPSQPPARLRDRIVSQSTSLRVWPWAAAAAMLLVSALTLRVAAQREAGRVDLGADPSAAFVADLADALGGDAAARQQAESLVLEAQLRSEMTAQAPALEGDQP